MPTLTVNGRKVKVDDSFLKMSPEDQEATVQEIASSFGQEQQARQPMHEFFDVGDEVLAPPPAARGQAARALTENVVSDTTGLADTAVAGYRGLAAMFPGGKSPNEAVEHSLSNPWQIEPKSPAGQNVNEAMSKLGENIEQFADWAGEVSGQPGDTVGATAVKTAILALPMLLGAKRSPTTKSTPTIEALTKAANEAYAKADNAGVAVTRDAYGKFAESLKANLTDQGIDKGIHKKSFRAMKRVLDDEGEHLTLKGLQRIRQNINDSVDAAKSKGDRRMALSIRNQFDDFVKGLKDDDILAGDKAGIEAYYKGNELYARKSKAEEIDRIMEKAKNAAPNFSASGYENALRIQFRQLADNAARMRRFTKAEQKAILAAARGGPIGNVMRAFGRFMPTNPLTSAALGGIGYAAGGGLPLAIAMGGAGAAGRLGALASRKAKAKAASELIRRGEKAEPLKDKKRALTAAMLSEGQ